jgi:hypothetical protein
LRQKQTVRKRQTKLIFKEHGLCEQHRATWSPLFRPSVRVNRGRLGPGDLELLAKWIELNGDVLINYWNSEIEYTEDAINAIRPIGAASP